MLKLRENGLTIDYMYETNSVLRKTAETEISDLTFWLRFGSVRVFINRNRTEIRFPHIPIYNDIYEILEEIWAYLSPPPQAFGGPSRLPSDMGVNNLPELLPDNAKGRQVKLVNLRPHKCLSNIQTIISPSHTNLAKNYGLPNHRNDSKRTWLQVLAAHTFHRSPLR